MERLKALIAEERPAFPLWSPVLLGLGVQIYFWLLVEPPLWLFVLSLLVPVALWFVLRRRMAGAWLLGVAAGLVALGFALAGLRTHLVAAPVLTAQMDATIEGVIRDINRTSTGRPRLVLDDVLIFGVAGARTPERAQVSLLRDGDESGLQPGMRVSIFAHLGPPGGPVEPGGFDFRRDAWFKALGAIGYARGPAVEIAQAGRPGILRAGALWLAQQRAALSAGLRAALPGETGAFAAAVTVGDRSGISRESTQALRDSNLAHLLAISGLHMGLVTALVFGAARMVLVLIPYTARTWRTKRIAAVIAMAAAIGYLAISGGSIATQRAFIMAMVALGAVILNRPAITLRALAVAALIILVFRPESLVQVGFQMSFAATAAIIAGLDFARAQGWSMRFAEGGWRGRAMGYVLGLAATSLLAGLATAPFAAFHFHRVANYGLIANLAAVPVMGFWVAPSALIAAALAPLGLEGWALSAMGRGIETIMMVARFVASLDGATRGVAATMPLVLTLITLGGLALCLGRRLARPIGLFGVGAGLAIWLLVDTRPPLLIAPDARLMGLMGPEGRALDHAKSQSYAARIWLEGDGDLIDQEGAAARDGFTGGRYVSAATLPNGWTVTNFLKRRTTEDDLTPLCGDKTLVLAPYTSLDLEGPCQLWSRRDLAERGAMAIWADAPELTIVSAADRAGRRYWTGYDGTPDGVRTGAE
ncbi:MAG: ComEC/Rec2 family competence protein [Pseudomonadota bacterium]